MKPWSWPSATATRTAAPSSTGSSIASRRTPAVADGGIGVDDGPVPVTADPARPRRRIDDTERDRRRAQSDAFLLLLCAGVILASILLTPSDARLALHGVEIPPLCMFKRITGHDCFGCGLSRSFTYMGHGQVANAFRMHKLGPLLYLVVAAQIPLRARAVFAWWRRSRQGDGRAGDGTTPPGPGVGRG
ncbi:MAG: DUF2752 domain-containing protein [Deltaproteobacteria bacterium]|nr:MAG: DUF2752 domain-containing protein [Deltaproteobacteria bacterium]